MKKFFLTALGLVGLLLGSCQQDDHLGEVTQSGSKALKLVLSVQGMGTGETRATVDAEDGEQTINTLHLFFFEPSSDRSGTYQGYLKLDGPLTMNTDIELSSMGHNPDLDISSPYKILAVANAEDYNPRLGTSGNEWLVDLDKGSTTENSVFNNMLAYISGGEQIENDQIIMTGQADKPADALATIPLTLTRGLVRFDVVNSARTDYNLRSVSIYNAFPQTSMFGGGLIPYESMGRIRKLYGIDNSLNNGYPDIFGGLYTFPNQVISPEEKDQKTTCLIVCLQKADGSAPPSYHRININAQDAMQNLKRNNVYRLTILSVSGQGASTELEAYTGGVNNINYKINYWDLDDDGLIQQNGNIILGLPTKRIHFGAEADERSYDIFAFGGTVGEQIVVSTSDLAPGLTVSQSGNTITVNATALTAADQERTGTIRITYGGLTASIGILQSGEANKFLRITTPSGQGIPLFPYYQGAPSSVEVTASEEWTATIYNFGSSGFSFDDGSTTMSSTDLNKVVNLKTTNENNTGAPLQAFVLFTLNSDSDNYNSALVLTQRTRGRIELSPNINMVKWNGVGNLMTSGGGLSQTQFTFTVNPSMSDDGSKFLLWTAVLEDPNSGFKIVGQNYDETNPDMNYVTVEAKGQNLGTLITDVLKISLDNESTTYVEVNLEQESFELRISPDTFTPITNKGGSTGAISISSNKTTLTWSAEIESMASAKGTISSTHRAIIVDAVTNNPLVEGNEYSMSQEFKVKFPKLLYGDHKKGAVTATVKVTLWSNEGGVKKVANTRTFMVGQSGLEPAKLSIYNYRGSDKNYTQNWGSLYTTTEYYNQAWRSFITSLFTNYGDDIAYPSKQIVPVTRVYTTAEGVVLPTDQIKNSSPISSTVTYVHASQANGISKSNGSYGDQQGAIETWRQNDNGILVVTQSHPTYTGSGDPLFWPVRSVGWVGAGTFDASATTLRRDTGKKITKFIYEDGPFGPVVNDGSLTFKSNGSAQAMNITGTKGVAIMGSDTKASLVIDPASRILYFGEGEFFSSSTGLDGVSIELNNSKSILLANIAAYAILTAQYGSNFSDLLID